MSLTSSNLQQQVQVHCTLQHELGSSGVLCSISQGSPCNRANCAAGNRTHSWKHVQVDLATIPKALCINTHTDSKQQLK